MEIKIIRSERRRRTVSARIVDDTILVHAPENIHEQELEKIIQNFKTRFERKKLKEELNKKEGLKDIAQRLNERYFGGNLKINSIEYVTNQNRQFGCCSYKSKNIRLSHRLSTMPDWVRDYVIVNEIAHLIEPNHSNSFWEIVSRYKLAERARGYLLAKGFEAEDESDVSAINDGQSEASS